ncbi:hypothetical protein DSCW_26130 [Desulfosarcina widdelii]|uniref:Uncharacterized protein n=1 Tax=Desulfosarcina widdelii TaxID=947919 RepID=A0A5K7Z0J1_9BACT|nr:hypothetical protein [Desulfosarcina widdelii]BBO75196.1 hypothetical protein DSCW_26130 [Desulfosarcina widdelii]
MKCIDEIKVADTLGSTIELQNEMAAVAELMINDQPVGPLPNSILCGLGTLLSRLFDAQRECINEIASLIDEAPAAAANHAEASGSERERRSYWRGYSTTLFPEQLSIEGKDKQAVIHSTCGKFWNIRDELKNIEELLSKSTCKEAADSAFRLRIVVDAMLELNRLLQGLT